MKITLKIPPFLAIEFDNFSFNLWWKAKYPPRWVRRASGRWKSKRRYVSHGYVKYFKGKHYMYKAVYKTVSPNKIKEYYYRKKRIR